jgi:hypothetical protein
MRGLLAAVLVAASLTGCTLSPVTAAPCPTEDYDGPTACVWDAHQRGNHEGRSFVWDGHQIHYTSK